MMPVEISKIIKEMYEEKGQNISEISNALGYDRKTVRKYAKGGECGYHREGYLRPLRDEIFAIIENGYVSDLKGPKKQRRTAQKMHQDLGVNYKYLGSYTTVKKVVREIKLKYKEVFVPREHKAGETSEYDLGYAQVKLNGVQVEMALHCHQLTYSNDIFVYASIRENAQEVLLSHEKAFAHFEGVPAQIRYDNLKQVVKAFLGGSRREEQDDYRNFRVGYGFEAKFCEARKGWQKGDVEGCVGYCRRSFFSPVPEYKNVEDLNIELSRWCKSIRSQRIVYGSTQTVSQRWEEETALLLPIPPTKPVAGKRSICKADHYSLINVCGVKYSVPSTHAHQFVDVVVLADMIQVYKQTTLIATHPRSYDKTRQVFDPCHYLPVFRSKPYSLVNSKPIAQLGPIVSVFFEKAYQKGATTARACAEVLSLLKTVSFSEFETALGLAVAYETYHFEGIKNILGQLNTAQLAVPDMVLPEALQSLELTRVDAVDLSRYNSLAQPHHCPQEELILC